MTSLDDVRAVIELAALTEDRTPAESRALLRIAVSADKEANATTTTNRRRGEAWRLHRLIEDVQPTVDERAKLDRQADAYERWVAGERTML